jgi:hypothetical protein
MTIADYCAALDRKELAANPEYQRSDKVWPSAAKSFLIETILLGYPLPKIFLFQKTDLKSKKTIKEIVDGQQRSKAIHDFYNNKLRISKKSELLGASGRRYDQLDEGLQGSFLNYQLSIDLFVAATPSEIRQAFRRLNSYTVPLNPEELRHAEYQGKFKWFIYKLSEAVEQRLLDFGVFKIKQIVRMQDAKLWTEFVHALFNGVKTTKAKDLTALYRDFDREFPASPGDDSDVDDDQGEESSAGASSVTERVREAMDRVGAMTDLHDGPLMKPHVFYTLLLAMTHVLKPAEKLDGLFDTVERDAIDWQMALVNLSKLANSLETEEGGEFPEFKFACSEKTNVDTQRKLRVQWLGRALQPEPL